MVQRRAARGNVDLHRPRVINDAAASRFLLHYAPPLNVVLKVPVIDNAPLLETRYNVQIYAPDIYGELRGAARSVPPPAGKPPPGNGGLGGKRYRAVIGVVGA